VFFIKRPCDERAAIVAKDAFSQPTHHLQNVICTPRLSGALQTAEYKKIWLGDKKQRQLRAFSKGRFGVRRHWNQ
jgi:hypothetical protein